MAKKKKDPLAAAAQQVVKKTTDKVVKQTTQKRTAEQKVRSAAKGVAGNIVKNKAPGTVKSATKNRTASKPFKASNISGNTGRSIKKQDRERTAKKYATMNHAKRTAKSNVTATQKGEKVMGGNAVQRNVLQKNKPTRLSRMDDFMLTDRGKNEVNNAKALYEVARRNNDEAGMKLAHGMAELARLNNQTRRRNDSGDIVGPYSGGTWGDRYIEANMGNFNTGQTGLREPEKNFLRSEAYQVKSALNEAGAGYLNTLREFPLRLPEGQGSSQLMIKGSDQDKYSSNVVDRRGQSRYTEEDMANKALEFQAASDAQRELGYQTTPINGFAGQFIGDATRVATGIGLDAAANAVVPGAGLVNMGARTWGTQVKQAKDEQKLRGTDKEPFADLKAFTYGTAMTAVEVATEKMFDGVKLFGKSVYGAGGATTKLGKMMDDVFNVGINRAVARLAKTPGGEAAISALMNIGKSGLEEGLEELVADFVQWQMPRIYGGDFEGAKEMLSGALYDFALGAAMGGFGGVTSTGSVTRQAYLDRTKRNAEAISDRMSNLGADKEQAKTALSRMTINQLESLAEASDDVLRNTGMAMGLISSQNANQSLTEAPEEQRSEQTVEDGQPAVSRSKAKDALRKRLRSMDIRDADRLRGIMDGLSAQEMDTASKMSAEDLSAWVDGRESGEITPAEPQAEPANIAEDAEEEDDAFAITPGDIRALGNKLERLGVKGPEIARAVSDDATIEQLINMDEEELLAWAQEQMTPAQPEALAEQTELLEAQRQERQEEAQAPATPLERSASVLGAAGRTAFISSYNPSKRSDLYTAEAYRAYNAGFTGNVRPTLYKTLNRASSEALYQAGVIDRQSSMRARENKKRNAIVFDKNTSELYWDENVERAIASYSQAEGVRRFTQKDAQNLDRIVRALGKKAFFVESIDSLTEPGKHDIANGSYADGILKISLKTVDPISFTFGHEITHAMAEMSPKEYKRLERFVMGLEQSESQLAAIRKAYEDLKLPLSQETAIEEVVADYVGQMVTDLDLLERFARQVDRNVLQKFFDALRSLARKLTGKDKEDVNKAVKLVENMLSASVKQNKRMAKMNVSSEDILEGKAIVNSETGERYSIRASTFDINEGVMFEDLVNAEIMTQKEADELRENMSNLVREMIPYAHILDQNEEWSREDRPYSPLKPNSDPLYKISLDFTTLCRKRLLTQAIIERIQMEEKKAVSSDRQLKIRSLLQEYREIDNAVQVACGMCYVEAARLKSPKVVNEFLKNPAPTVRNYFAKKDSGFEARLKADVEQIKIRAGYDPKTPKKGLPHAVVEKINAHNAKERKTYALSAAQKELMDKIKAMPPETFLSEANLTRLLVEEPVIYDIFISKVRAATRSKALQGPVPYYYGDSKGALSDKAIERMNAENGLRFQSWSDWQVQHLLDMMTAVIDLSVRGVKMHGYTKFPEEVRIFGNTGMQFNLSGVLGTVDPIINEDGTYSEDNFDSVEGVDIKEAKKVRDEFPDTAGIQCIGVSDAQILSLLNTDWVDYVIPYHSSGLNKALRKIAGIEKWEDYTKVQEAHPIDKKAEPGPGQDAENWHKEPAFSEFMVWDGENGLDCMRKSADRYVKLCEERGMVPKFNDLRTSGKPGAENYWKLLIDRKMINQKTGELIIQQAVRPNFNFKAMRDAIKREVDSYDPSRENRVFKYVVENGSKKGIRFSREMKEKAASLGNTVIENVVSDSAEKLSVKNNGTIQYQSNALELTDQSVRYSIRRSAPPKNTGTAYKVFYAKDGQLYPPMVANPGGEGTPVGVWLDADIGRQAPPSKTGRPQVKAGGKGTQGSSGSLAFRPGWHLGDIPHATQFARVNPENGKKELFPENFVWAECEYAADVDYQEEAMSYGYTENGKFRHSYAGLPRLPEDGYYRYRTNPKPDTVPWIITGAMKVNRILTDEETDAICRENGVEPLARVGGPLTAESMEKRLGIKAGETTPKYSARGTGYQFNNTVVLEESTIDKYLKNYAAQSSPNYAQAYIAHMSPKQFIDLTTTKIGKERVYKEATPLDTEGLAEATRHQPFFLRIDHDTQEVVGHEGRHRLVALSREGIDTVPVLIFDSANKYNKEPMTTLGLQGQDFGHDRSHAMVMVHDLLPLSYANRDEIIRRFATQPTDERIAENYGRQTVRYSARGTGYQPSTQRDADYMDAVQDGDMDTAQRMVDEAAKEAGFDSPRLYHGTPAGGFTEFDSSKSQIASGTSPAIYFTPSIEIAEKYYAVDNSMAPGQKQIYEVYLNVKNPLVIECNGNDWNRIELPKELQGKGIGRFYDPLIGGYRFPMTASTDQLAEYARNNGYDGVIFRNVRDGKTGETPVDVYAVFESSQIKSADPVVYDDNGKVIPLSERFDPDKQDIRWSIRGGLTYDQMVERYGSIKPGERRARNVAVPKQTSDKTKVHQTIRTIMEAGRTPEDILPRLKEMIESGEFSYEVFGNREGVEYAQGVVAEKGFAEAYKDWSAEIEKKIVSPQNVAMGWVLYDTAVENKGWDMVARISMQMAKYANTIGQGLQAMRILKMFSPEMQLAVMDGPKPERVRKKLEKRKQQEEQPADTYDEEEEEDDDIDLPGAFFGEEDEEKQAQKKPRKKPQRRTPREEQSDTNEDESDTEITQKDVEETAEYQARQHKSSLLEMWNSWRYLAMLFNARTHIRNIIGNLGFAPVVMSKNVTATAAEIAIYHTVGKHFGMKRTKGVYNPRMFAYAWKDFEQMRPTIMGEAKYEGQEPKPDEVVFRGILAPLEKARKLNSAALDLEDAWFSRPQYANALAQYMAANGITVEMMETGAGEITRGPHKGEHITAKIMDEARAYAVLEAQKATYRDLNDLSQFFMRVGKPKTDDPTKVERVFHVLIEGVIPFRKTPANILVRAMEYSPVGFAHGMKKLLYDVPATYHVRNRLEKLQEKIDAGEDLTEKEKKFREKASKFEPTTVAEALDRICSGMNGTAIFALGMTLAKLGILVAKTDNGDDDQKYFTKLLGHQQWALEVGGYSITIDWLAPEVVPLFMGAQYFTGFNEGDPIRNFSSLADSLSMVIDPVLELSCMSGIQEALNNAAAFSEGDVNTMVGLASSLGLSYLSQGIPTLFGQLERASQAERMTTFTQDEQLIPSDWQYQIGKLSAKIPVLDYHQIPYVDSWGNTETETSLFKRIVANMFNPAYVKKIDTRAVNKELQRLYDATGDGNVLPGPGWKTYNYTDENGKNQTVYLSEEEYLAYSRAKGRTQFDLVDKFVKSKAYKSMTDSDRVSVINEIYNYSEYKAQQQYIHDFKGKPRGYKVDDYEEFASQYGNVLSFSDYVVLDKQLDGVQGLKSANYKNGKKTIPYTKSDNLIISIHNSGIKIPTDQQEYEAFMSAFDVADSQKGWSKSMAEADLAKYKKKYGITE